MIGNQIDMLSAPTGLGMLWVLFALGGHFGTQLTFYNRINATGLPRRTIKRTSKLMFAGAITLPIFAAWVDWPSGKRIYSGASVWDELPMWLLVYGTIVQLCGSYLLVRWLMDRPIVGRGHVPTTRTVEVVDVASSVSQPLPRTRRCRLMSHVPGNQMFELSIERIELPVVGLPSQLDGYRIAQLSDIHFTGYIDPAFTRYAVDRAMEFDPELMAVTGDIIDHEDCLQWLPGTFGTATATDGCHFILGNHDKRIDDSDRTRQILVANGWNDLGGKVLRTHLRDCRSLLLGNESPWYPPPPILPSELGDAPEFRLLLSHSPDQIDWARRYGVTLMLAGHTHGGQGRLPIAGPILSPSWYGSRFASGDFYLSPTTLHVSRGLSGTHLIRLRCRPELSLVTLKKVPASSIIKPALRSGGGGRTGIRG